MEIDRDRMVRFFALGLEIPEDNPDRSKYVSLKLRKRQMAASDVPEITLLGPGDILFLYTDGVYDRSDEQDRQEKEPIIRYRKQQPAIDTRRAILNYSLQQ